MTTITVAQVWKKHGDWTVQGNYKTDNGSPAIEYIRWVDGSDHTFDVTFVNGEVHRLHGDTLLEVVEPSAERKSVSQMTPSEVRALPQTAEPPAPTPPPDVSEIAAIKARLAKITPGQWVAEHDTDHNVPFWIVESYTDEGTDWVAKVMKWGGFEDDPISEHDAKFIANAPADITALLAALDTANAEVAATLANNIIALLYLDPAPTWDTIEEADNLITAEICDMRLQHAADEATIANLRGQLERANAELDALTVANVQLAIQLGIK